MEKTICNVQGIWHEYLEIDGKTYWKFEDFIAHEIVNDPNPLPSDSSFRKDSIIWKTQNVEKASEAKEELENIQRRDRKLRADYL